MTLPTDDERRTGAMRPEAALLACCARARPRPEPSDRLHDLLSAGIDWDLLIRLAREHGVEPLLYRSLSTVASGWVPPEVMTDLRAGYRANAAHSLALLAETARLLAACRAAGIDVIPLKGPVTALTAYGDVALRDSVDIDLLVRPEDAARAARILSSERYQPEHEVTLTESQHRAFIGLCQHERFVGRGSGIEVELHWRPAPLAFAPALGDWDPWARCRPLSWGGSTIPVPSPEDHLLLLCLHGYSHLFCCLKWVCDVAALVQSQPTMAHQQVLREASRLGGLRAVLVGSLLARDLLRAPVPRCVLGKARADRGAASVAAAVVRRYARGEPLRMGLAGRIGDLRLHLSAAGGLRARVSFCLRRIAPHSKRDLAWLSLPAPLLPLYWLTGPVAAIKQAAAMLQPGAGGMGRRLRSPLAR